MFSSFGLSKKPVSPRPNTPEEREGDSNLLKADDTRKRSKSKSKNLKKRDEPPLTNEAEVSLSSDDEKEFETKGEQIEEIGEEEAPNEEFQPFDANTSLLVFHTGQVYVREKREVVVQKGGCAVIRDLPSTIHPASIHFSSATDSDASIIEQTLENGADSFDALLGESVGEAILLRLRGNEEVVKGKLLRATETEVVLETEDGTASVFKRTFVVGAEASHESFNKEPSLHCVVETQQEGAHAAQLTYEAAGITWSAEYTLVVHKEDSTAEFTGWFTLENKSGKTYKDTALALVAAPETTIDYSGNSSPRMKPNKMNFISSFGKRKNYKPKVSTQNTSYLPRPVTLIHGKDKQIRITHATFPIEQANLFRKFVIPYAKGFHGAHSDHSLEGHAPVNKILRWTNSKATHHRLGIELAAGSIDVLESVKEDTFLNLRHQDQLKFSRPGEEIFLITGQHADLNGERRVTELRSDAKTRTIRESVMIEIKNSGTAEQEVVVEDVLWRWHTYTISPCQPKYDGIARGKQVMTWRLTVPAKSTETIRYTVLYSNVPQ